MFKNALVVVVAALGLFGGSQAKAGSTETWICLKNGTDQSKTILVESVDNYDWDGVSRPDRNWNGVDLSPGETRCARGEVNDNADSHGFDFVISGRAVPHRVRMILSFERGVGNSWKPIVERTVAESILIGTGRTVSRDGYQLHWPVLNTDCKTRNLVRCSLFTIQDVP